MSIAARCRGARALHSVPAMRPHRLILGSLAASFSVIALTACDNSGTTCAAFENTARTELASAQKGYLACQVDTDCVSTPVNQDGACAAACGGLTSKASAASYVDTAASVCQEFNASGCTALGAGCPASGPVLCAGGTCTLYFLSLAAPSSPITHGVCAAFEVDYTTPAGSADAPHDITVAVSAAGGTLYADVACTTPLATGTVTLPGGAPDVGFGFEAQAAGPFSISVPGGGGSYVAE
jgi:hypothetical protein